ADGQPTRSYPTATFEDLHAGRVDRAGFDVVLIADEFPHAQELGLTAP
ncbi:MAG: hypothetical protein QOG20_3782, partial [Pseudonocardiales bacterium]|nr:hypothetical protein [Pseudonocardiales bacterium]